MALEAIKEEQERNVGSIKLPIIPSKMHLEKVVGVFVGCTAVMSLSSIRTPTLTHSLRSKIRLQLKIAKKGLQSTRERFGDSRRNREEVTKQYKKVSSRVKSTVRNALARIEDLKAQASVSFRKSIPKIDQQDALLKHYESVCDSVVSTSNIVRRRLEEKKYVILVSLRSVLLQLDTGVKSKVGLATLEQHIHRSICEREAQDARSRRCAALKSSVIWITQFVTGHEFLGLGLVAALGTGAHIIMKKHRR
eukprot:scaffold2331_cov126-Cylindrotheca_fusiformis.AAC.10